LLAVILAQSGEPLSTPLPSHTKSIATPTPAKLTPTDVNLDNTFTPSLYYFHFVVQRTKDSPVTQTYPYVQWATRVLIIDCGILMLAIQNKSLGQMDVVNISKFILSTFHRLACNHCF